MKKIISEKKFKAGYIVKEEKLSGKDFGMPKNKSVTMKSAYNFNGNYIGSPKTAYRLCKLRGIKPEVAHKNDNVCSIGYCEKEKKWFGWSHRAIYGFKIGNKITNKVSGFSRIRKTFKIKTLNEAKKVAKKFAESVS